MRGVSYASHLPTHATSVIHDLERVDQLAAACPVLP